MPRIAPRWTSWATGRRNVPGPLGASGTGPTIATVSPVATFPDVPLGLLVELFLDGEWVDITSYVYARDPIRITRGRQSEASSVETSLCRMSLNNRDGRFSPRNPRSPYYGQLGRNTPIRVSVRSGWQEGTSAVVLDSFSRVVVDSGWGVSDSGHSWVVSGDSHVVGVSYNSVSAGQARTSITGNTPLTVGAYLPGLECTDIETVVTFTNPVATGGSIVGCGITTHYVAADSHGPRIEVLTSPANTVAINFIQGTQWPGGGSSDLGFVVVSGLTHSGQPLRVRTQVHGQTISARVWDPSGPEPTDWQLVATDTYVYPIGSVELYARTYSGNTNSKPQGISFDDLQIVPLLPRFTGEVSSWPPQWLTGGRDVWVEVEAAGILRRLGQGNPASQSILARFLSTATPETSRAAYWPLEDGQMASAGAPLSGSESLALSTPLDTTTYWSQGMLAPWLAPVIAMHGGDTLTGSVAMPNYAGIWSVLWMRAGSESASESSMTIYCDSPVFGIADQRWEIRANPSTQLLKVVNPGAVTTTASAAALFNGGPHLIEFNTSVDAFGTAWKVKLDGVTLFSDIYVSTSAQPVVQVQFRDLAAHDTPLAIGHLTIWTFAEAPTLPTYAFGHNGETAGDRISRLCEEEQIPFTSVGDLSTTTQLGVQAVSTPLELMRAAAEVDGGILYEPRDALGLAYRTRESMYNQDPAVTLDYNSGGHVAPPLTATDDDQMTRNDVTVIRAGGGSTRVTQDTGPLSTQAPPDGAGRYDTSVTLNLFADIDALDQAAWRVHLGTVDEARFPHVNLSLTSMGSHNQDAFLTQAAQMDLGDRFTIANPPTWLPPRPISQLVQGFGETLDQVSWSTTVNASPASAWAIAVVQGEEPYVARVQTDGSAIAATTSPTGTTLSVATTAGQLWTTTSSYPDDFPFDIEVQGVRITVTGITGTTSPQTFSVIRNVDGFDVSLPAGSAVRLWDRTYVGL